MENSNKICRFCLFGEKNISDKFVNICSLDYFGEKLSNCLGINVSPEDSIPPLICENCFNFTHKIHNFLMTVERSEIVLKELFAAESRKPLDKKGDNINNSNEKSRLINCHSTPQIIDEIHSSNEFISCDSDSSDDNIIKSENQVVDSFSSPDLQKKKSITFPPQQNKVDIFGTDEMKKKLYEYIYTCSICSRSFHTFFEYQDHQHLHNGQLAFHCSKCDEVFSNRNELVEHEKNHKVSCEKCDVKVLPRSLEAHKKKHTDMYKCATCEACHTSKAALEKHFKARHAGIKGYVCHICGKQNSCQSSMQRHLALHMIERPYKCEHCSFSAKSRNVLQVHTSRQHSNQPCICNDCGKQFKSVLSLKQHMKRIHDPKKNHCKICDKSFSEKFNLDQHILKKHSSQRIYECKICHKEFFTVRKLKEHMLSHRQGCVNCPKCRKQFFYKKYLDRHLSKCNLTNEDISPEQKANSSITSTEYNS